MIAKTSNNKMVARTDLKTTAQCLWVHSGAVGLFILNLAAAGY